MYGCTITINGRVARRPGDIAYQGILCSNYMIKKFEQDKVFAETDDFILLLDGVILNRKDLIAEYIASCSGDGESQWVSVLECLYKRKGEQFFAALRGSFAGALYDKGAKKWIIFSDQIGSKFIYYALVGDFFCCSQEMGHIYQMLRDNGITYHMDSKGAWMLLTYGFMLDNVTLCEEVRKINPGCYITLQNGILKEHRYYLVNNTPDLSISEQDAIEIIDHYFRKAVTREFEKDREYNYRHLVCLSGGLDCRMTSFVAHDCGFTDQLNMTFSQTGYWDQTLPMRMSAALKHEWIFKALDNGIWLYDVDDIIHSNGGNVLYYGTAHANSLLKYINFEHLGLEHTGQLGDVILGSFVKANERDVKYSLGDRAYSKQYLDHLMDYRLTLDTSKEIGLFYYRGFNGTNNGLQYIYNYTEVLSPFFEIDFMEKALSIPLALRQNHYIYKKWILAKYPKAAEFEWETTGRKITDVLATNAPRSFKSYMPSFIMTPLRQLKRRITGKSIGGTTKQDASFGMNPLDYYLSHNRDLLDHLSEYFQYTDAISDKEIRSTLEGIKDSGTAIEKIQAISLLGAVKLFYSW